MAILALDVGTSSLKAALLDQATGLPLAEPVHQRYALRQPEPEAAVIDPGELWAAVAAAATEVAAGQKVDGLGFSVLSPGMLLLDPSFQPLTPIITHLDRRCRETAAALRDAFGSRFLELNGNPLIPGLSGVTAHWLLNRDAGLRAACRHLWHVNTWLAWRLTGQAAMDPGNAAFTGLCAAIQGFDWSAELIERLRIPRAWLPPIQDGRTVVGGLHGAAARDLGLPAGTPVRLGVPDTSSAALAVGLQPGELLHVVGTTQVLAAIPTEPRPALHRLTRPLGVGRQFLHVTHNPVGGVALDWLHELCFRDQPVSDYYGKTVPAALSWQPHGVRLEPFFLGGDRLEVAARTASFQGLHLQTDRMDLLAALLQGMLAGHRLALAQLELNATPTRVFLSGGGAEIVRGLVPEYGQIPVEQPEQASLRGVARLFD